MQKTDETFQNDINSQWIRKLIGEFYYMNCNIRSKLGDNKWLKDPNFAFDYNSHKWGTWNSETRTLTLSYKLLHDCEWDDVVYTLKHEVAHMIVSEIFMADGVGDNNKSHGELFAKACNILDINSTPKWTGGSYSIPEKEKILSRIYKLFCLGESNHKSEAESAVNKAHELMFKYNISIKELPKEKRTFVSRPVGLSYKKVPHYIKTLARIISEYYFVKYIYMPLSFNKGHYIEFYGEPHNVDIAEYIFHFLINEGERQWNDFQKTPEYISRYDEGIIKDSWNRKIGAYKERRKGKYSKVAFICGVYDGFSCNLSKIQENVKKEIDPTNTLPIISKDPLLEEKYNKQYHPRTWNSGGGSNGGGYSEGAEVGKNIVIRQSVKKGNNSSIQLISA